MSIILTLNQIRQIRREILNVLIMANKAAKDVSLPDTRVFLPAIVTMSILAVIFKSKK